MPFNLEVANQSIPTHSKPLTDYIIIDLNSKDLKNKVFNFTVILK